MANEPFPKEFCMIRDDGFYHVKVAERFIGKQVDMLKDLVNREPVQVGKVFDVMIPQLNKSECSSHTVTMIQGTNVFFSVQLDMIRLKTLWGLNHNKDMGGLCLVPVFHQERKKGCVLATKDWVKPETMIIDFIVEFTILGIIQKCYIVASESNEKKCRMIPLPNVFENAEICMGHDRFIMPSHNTFQKRFQAAVDHFYNTQWNADLSRGQTQRANETLMRFDLKGNQVHSQVDWKTFCPLTSNEKINGVLELLWT